MTIGEAIVFSTIIVMSFCSLFFLLKYEGLRFVTTFLICLIMLAGIGWGITSILMEIGLKEEQSTAITSPSNTHIPVEPLSNANLQAGSPTKITPQTTPAAPTTVLNSSQQKPTVMTTLSNIRLGMSRLEVTLLKGAPHKASDITPDPMGVKQLIFYSYSDGAFQMAVTFRGQETDMIVTDVCTTGGNNTVLGFQSGTPESKIIDKLGQPTHISINAQGTAKISSYPVWNTAFTFEKGKASEICITSREKIAYFVEHPTPVKIPNT